MYSLLTLKWRLKGYTIFCAIIIENTSGFGAEDWFGPVVAGLPWMATCGDDISVLGI